MSPENAAAIDHIFGPGAHRASILPATSEQLERALAFVRAEERARAIEVVKPFLAVAAHLLPEVWNESDEVIRHLIDLNQIGYEHLRRAAAYITDTQLLAKSASNSAEDQFAEIAKCPDTQREGE